jgi:hypothetical protein
VLGLHRTSPGAELVIGHQRQPFRLPHQDREAPGNKGAASENAKATHRPFAALSRANHESTRVGYGLDTC